MITDRQFLEVAKSYIGTPYHHCGRVRAGVDCAGLVVLVARDCGLSCGDLAGYHRRPDNDGSTLMAVVQGTLQQIDPTDMRPGDVGIFFLESRARPTHAGIISQVGLIHATEDLNQVTEHRIDKFWSRHLHSVWRWPDMVFTINREALQWQL